MTCILRIPGLTVVALVLAALIAAPPAAGAAPAADRPAAQASGDDGWADRLTAPWRALRELILNVAGADGTEPPPPPPPPPPEEGDEMKPPPPPPTCPSGQTSGPCIEPNG